MPLWTLLPFVAPFLIHVAACVWLAGRLERERRRAGDPRPVPGLFDPMTSHRWAGVLFTERTSRYRRSTRRAFLIARAALALVPIGIVITAALGSRFYAGAEARVAAEGPPPLTLAIPAAD